MISTENHSDESKINTLELRDLKLTIEKDIGLLVGNDFLEEYIVTIDWSNNKLYLQPISN